MPLTLEDLRRLFDEHREPLFAFLRRLTGDHGAADDLVQDTFLRVWQRRARYEDLAFPGAFLRAVSFRLYLTRRRRTARRRALAPPACTEPTVPSGDDQVAGDEERRLRLEHVRRELDGLPPALREAFELYRVRGLSVQEIAQLTRSPTKTVETRVRRATLALAKALGPARSDPSTLPASSGLRKVFLR